MSPLDFDSGPAGLVALLLGVLSLPFALFTPLAIGFMKWRVPASLGWLPATLCMLVGMLGAVFGTSGALGALGSAPPDLRQTLVARGIAESLSAMTSATAMTGLALLVFAGAAWLPTAIATGPGSSFSSRSSAGAFLGAMAGFVTSLIAFFVLLGLDGFREAGVSAYLLPPVAMLGTLFIVLSSLRESDEREHQGRIAGARMAVLTANVVGLLLLGEFFRYVGINQAFQAVAYASPEMKAQLMAAGIEYAGYALRVAVCVIPMPLLAGFGGQIGVLGRADSREFLGAAVAGVQIMLMFAALGIANGRILRLFDLLLKAS